MSTRGASSLRGRRPADRRRSLFLSEIFWPSTLLDCKEHAFLIGWNLDNFNCCIVNVIPIPEDAYDEVNEALQRVLNKKFLGFRRSKNNTLPVILGEWFPPSPSVVPQSLGPPEAHRQDRGIWITLSCEALRAGTIGCEGASSPIEPGLRPVLISLYSCGCRYNTACYMFRYEAVSPESHCYLTVELPKDFGFYKTADISASSGGPVMSSSNKTDLEWVVEQINSSTFLQHYLMQELSTRSRGADPTVGMHVTAYNVPWSNFLSALAWLITRIGHLWWSISTQCGIIIARCSSFTLALSNELSWPVHSSHMSSDWIGGEDIRDQFKFHLLYSVDHLKRHFNSVQISMHAFCQTTRNTDLSPLERQNYWIFLWSYILITLADVGLGCACGALMVRYNEELVAMLSALCDLCQNYFLLNMLAWFNSSPGGLKLNPLLTAQIGATLTSFITYYGNLIFFFRGIYPHLLFILADLGVFGVTMQMTAIVDTIRVLSLQINVIQLMFSFLHKAQISILTSMWYLFTGRKKNVLRKRIDTGKYSQSQVIIGTTVFAISFFLFPTFCVYYAAFTLAQMLVVSICTFLLLSVSVFQSFPICHLLLHFYYPKSLTRGIHLRFADCQETNVHRAVAVNGSGGGNFGASASRRRSGSGGGSSGAASLGLAFAKSYSQNAFLMSSNRIDTNKDYKLQGTSVDVLNFDVSRKSNEAGGILKNSPTRVNNMRQSCFGKDLDCDNYGSNSKQDSISIPKRSIKFAVTDSFEEVDPISPRTRMSSIDGDSTENERATSDKSLQSAIIEEPGNRKGAVLPISKEYAFIGDYQTSDPEDEKKADGNSIKYQPLEEYSFKSMPDDADDKRSHDRSIFSGRKYSGHDAQSYCLVPSLPARCPIKVDATGTKRTYTSLNPLHGHAAGSASTKNVPRRAEAELDVSYRSHFTFASKSPKVSGSNTVHLNIVPQPTSISTILLNYVHRWNNKKNRDFGLLFCRELVSSVLNGSQSLNLRSICLMFEYCYKVIRGDPANGTIPADTSDRAARTVSTTGIDGHIFLPSGGETLIDYFDRSNMPNMFASGPQLLQSDTFTDAHDVEESSLTSPPSLPNWTNSFDEYQVEHDGKSSQSDGASTVSFKSTRTGTPRAIGQSGVSVLSDKYIDKVAVCVGPAEEDDSDPTNILFAEKAAAVSSSNMSSELNLVELLWDDLYRDCLFEINQDDIFSSTFNRPVTFLCLFILQSVLLLFLLSGAGLLVVDVFYLWLSGQ